MGGPAHGCKGSTTLQYRKDLSSRNPQSHSVASSRDIISAPFSVLKAKSININIYFDDISGDKDALIFVPGSHHNLTHPPIIGDILAYDPSIYYTPSGKGCWQFRYVESPTTFSFGSNRFPHGLVPWTLAHASGIAPHGLANGDALLEGPWYPRVVPSPLVSEHVPLPQDSWGIWAVLGVTKEAKDTIQTLGIGTKENCNMSPANSNDNNHNHNGFAYIGLDGPVMSCQDWEMVQKQLPVHKNGQIIHTMKAVVADGRE
jgi:hypothetical protein